MLTGWLVWRGDWDVSDSLEFVRAGIFAAFELFAEAYWLLEITGGTR